jgi:cold shock CspA family protein
VLTWNGVFGKVSGSDHRAYFVHGTELIDTLDLTVGSRVEFAPAENPRGPRAEDVRRIEA